jgi:hypothetical protein
LSVRAAGRHIGANMVDMTDIRAADSSFVLDQLTQLASI